MVENKDKICVYCKKEFPNIKHAVFANHVRWCDKDSKNNENMSIGLKAFFDKKLGKIKAFDVKCEKCEIQFTVNERENKHPERKKYFCSRKCGNSHVVSDDTKLAISKKLKINFEKEIICAYCKNEFIAIKERECCSRTCASKKKYEKNRSAIRQYRLKSYFAFNLADFPEEFDLSLITKFGWYKAKNHGDNLSGISRDHRISITYGFENNIDPSVISHPANCLLMRHNENISKGKKCTISLEELLVKIYKWNQKYTN